MSQGDDFLGWAPAQPLDFDSSPFPAAIPPAPVPRVPEPPAAESPRRPPAPAGRPAPQRPRPPSPPALAEVSRAAQGIPSAQHMTPGPGGRRSRPASPLFAMMVVAFCVLLVFTLLTGIRGLVDGTGLGSVAIFTGIATVMVGRAALGMRPRRGRPIG